MPHAEIKHSSDLSLDYQAMFTLIEHILNEHDSSAGACKCRAYPSNAFLHTHVVFEISILQKPHRDESFIQSLVADLKLQLKGMITQNCHFSLSVAFIGTGYSTGEVKL